MHPKNLADIQGQTSVRYTRSNWCWKMTKYTTQILFHSNQHVSIKTKHPCKVFLLIINITIKYFYKKPKECCWVVFLLWTDMCYFPLHGWDCTLKIKSPSIYSILSHRRRIVPVPLGFTSLSDSAALYQNRTTNRELSKWMYSRRVMKLNYTYRLIIHSLVSIPSRCHNILYIHLHLHLWFYLANIYILNLGCQNS